jgi:hypothetical protein
MATGAALPNPAVEKCLNDGWRTEPQLVNGVPSGTVCIHPANGVRCEAWSYFRGECAGTATPTPNKSKGNIKPGKGGEQLHRLPTGKE